MDNKNTIYDDALEIVLLKTAMLTLTYFSEGLTDFEKEMLNKYIANIRDAAPETYASVLAEIDPNTKKANGLK